MQQNEKLKSAMEQIKAILIKNDIAGAVVLHTPGAAEYLYKIDPKYSIVRVEGKEIFYKLDAKHYRGDIEKRNQAAADTANMLSLMADLLQGMAFNTLTASKFIDEKLGAKHTNREHSNA